MHGLSTLLRLLRREVSCTEIARQSQRVLAGGDTIFAHFLDF
jgi:hypothetical protein